MKFNTRKLAREFALANGLNTSAVVDNGTDKSVGERWEVRLPVTVAVKNPVLGLGGKTLTLKTNRSNGSVHDVKVFVKKSRTLEHY
ncbi:hypothetical protein MM5_051 [Morganella phage vB_Mm5]